MSDFTTLVSSAGITLTWGGETFGVTQMQWSGSAAGEVDITSMISAVIEDENNSDHKLIKKSVDYSVIDLGELTCEFISLGGFSSDQLGSRDNLTVNGTDLSAMAYLTGMSHQVTVGEYVRGSCTFRLSNE